MIKTGQRTTKLTPLQHKNNNKSNCRKERCDFCLDDFLSCLNSSGISSNSYTMQILFHFTLTYDKTTIFHLRFEIDVLIPICSNVDSKFLYSFKISSKQ